jgi:hypothetical protein
VFVDLAGPNSVPDSFTYDDPHLSCDFWTWSTSTLTFEQAAASYGISVEALVLDSTHQAQEWMLTWERVAASLRSPPMAGRTRIAFSGGYADIDAPGDSVSRLRWLGRDPWASDAQEVNYWGDLLLPEGLLRAAPRQHSVRPAPPPGDLHHAELFDPQGRRVRADGSQASRLLLIRTADRTAVRVHLTAW